VQADEFVFHRPIHGDQIIPPRDVEAQVIERQQRDIEQVGAVPGGFPLPVDLEAAAHVVALEILQRGQRAGAGRPRHPASEAVHGTHPLIRYGETHTETVKVILEIDGDAIAQPPDEQATLVAAFHGAVCAVAVSSS
jgi:hypothetical protein